MRTGGDDIAQALALMGVRPTWDQGSGRVAGFEIMPLSILDRPRVDVTLRVSGFFRDAFPAQIDLIDSAARAVAALDEPEALNPLAARVLKDAQAMIASGLPPELAQRRKARPPGRQAASGPTTGVCGRRRRLRISRTASSGSPFPCWRSA